MIAPLTYREICDLAEACLALKRPATNLIPAWVSARHGDVATLEHELIATRSKLERHRAKIEEAFALLDSAAAKVRERRTGT